MSLIDKSRGLYSPSTFTALRSLGWNSLHLLALSKESLRGYLHPQVPVRASNVRTSPTMTQPEGAVLQKSKEKEDSEIKWGSEGWCHPQAEAQILILTCLWLWHLLHCSCSRDTCSLQSQIGDGDIQRTVLRVESSGLSCLCLAFWVVTPCLSDPLNALVKGTFTNGFPSVTQPLAWGWWESHSYFSKKPR